MNRSQSLGNRARRTPATQGNEVHTPTESLASLTFFIGALALAIGGHVLGGLIICTIGFITIVLGVVLVAPAVIFVSLISDCFQTPPDPPSPGSGALYDIILNSFDLYTKYGLPALAIGAAFVVFGPELLGFRQRAMDEAGSWTSVSSDAMGNTRVLVLGLAAALCSYNRLTRAQNDGQLPSFNGWLSLGCLVLLIGLLPTSPERLPGTLTNAETQSLMSEATERPPSYHTIG